MHLENSEKLKSWTQQLKPLLNKYNILQDIVLFGSFLREKTRPADIDIALLVQEKDENQLEKIEEEIRSLLPEHGIDITVLTLKDLYFPLWISIIQEGWSIAKEQYLAQLYEIEPVKLYKYSIKHMTPVQKVQFDRGLKKMTENLQGIRLTRAVILIPLQKSEAFEAFLKTWKIEYETQRYELLPEHRKTEKIAI